MFYINFNSLINIQIISIFIRREKGEEGEEGEEREKGEERKEGKEGEKTQA